MSDFDLPCDVWHVWKQVYPLLGFEYAGWIYESNCDNLSINNGHKMKFNDMFHRENGGTLGMVPLIINPIYTLYSGYLWRVPIPF